MPLCTLYVVYKMILRKALSESGQLISSTAKKVEFIGRKVKENIRRRSLKCQRAFEFN